MSMMPVEMFDHIIINRTGKPWAIYELNSPPGMASYRFHSDGSLLNYAAQLMALVGALPLEARLFSVAVPITAVELEQRIKDGPKLISEVSKARHDALNAAAKRDAKNVIARPAHSRKHFLCISLDTVDTPKASWKEAFHQIFMTLGSRRPPSTPQRRQELLRAAELAHASLGKLVTPATQEQVRWLMQRSIRRGLTDQPRLPASPKPEEPGAPIQKTHKAAYPTRPLLDATVIEGSERTGGGLPAERQLLRVQSSYGESLQTSLVMASMPPEWSFPQNGYWFAAADEFDFPLDVTVRIFSPPQHETKQRLRRRHKNLASQPEQYSGSRAGVPDAVLNIVERSNAAQSQLEGSKLSRIHQTITVFTVAASTHDELKRRVATVRSEFAAHGYELHTPTGDQTDLFFLGLPGTSLRPGGVVGDYEQDLTPQAIASGLPSFTPILGNDTGAYLGHRLDVGPPMPVLLSPSTTTSASNIGFGASGGGKSFTAKTIALHELMGGAQVVAIDRTNRGEYVQFAAGLPEYITSEVVDLGTQSEVSLCPMSTFGPENRIEITSSFLSLLAGVGARTAESARIAQVVEHVATIEGGNTQMALDVLKQWGEGGDDMARDLYFRILPLAKTRFAQLAFQKGSGVSLQGADLIILHASGLVLPSREQMRSREDLDANKAASIAMVYLLMALADVIGNTPNRLSSIILDEAWAFLDSSFGIDLANRVLRDGRKDYKKLQLWSQHPADAPQELLNMASNVFLTRQVEGAGAQALERIGAEPTPELVAMVEQLDIGQMVMRDERGRVGVLAIQPPSDKRLAAAFDTSPRAQTVASKPALPDSSTLLAESQPGQPAAVPGLSEDLAAAVVGSAAIPAQPTPPAQQPASLPNPLQPVQPAAEPSPGPPTAAEAAAPPVAVDVATGTISTSVNNNVAESVETVIAAKAAGVTKWQDFGDNTENLATVKENQTLQPDIVAASAPISDQEIVDADVVGPGET